MQTYQGMMSVFFAAMEIACHHTNACARDGACVGGDGSVTDEGAMGVVFAEAGCGLRLQGM